MVNIIVIGGPKLDKITTRYRRILLFERLQNTYLKGYNLFWLSSSKNIEDTGCYNNEIVLHEHGVLKGFEPFLSEFNKSILQRFNNENTLLIYTLHRHVGVINYLKGARVIYDISDNWTHKVNLKGILQYYSNRRILDKAEVVTVTSYYLQKKYGKKSRVYCVHTGGVLNPSFGGERSGAIIIGDLDNKKYDLRAILSFDNEIVIDHYGCCLLKGENLHIYERLISQGRLVPKGRTSYAELQRILPSYKYALLPYNNSDFAKGIYPLKTYELLNNGLHILFEGAIELQEDALLGITRISNWRCTENYDVNVRLAYLKKFEINVCMDKILALWNIPLLVG